jgi:hypothetical protein
MRRPALQTSRQRFLVNAAIDNRRLLIDNDLGYARNLA